MRKDEAEIAKEDETDSFWKTPLHLRLAGLPWPNVTRPSFKRLPATRPEPSTERLNPQQGRRGWKSKPRITQSACDCHYFVFDRLARGRPATVVYFITISVVHF